MPPECQIMIKAELFHHTHTHTNPAEGNKKLDCWLWLGFLVWTAPTRHYSLAESHSFGLILFKYFLAERATVQGNCCFPVCVVGDCRLLESLSRVLFNQCLSNDTVGCLLTRPGRNSFGLKSDVWLETWADCQGSPQQKITDWVFGSWAVNMGRFFKICILCSILAKKKKKKRNKEAEIFISALFLSRPRH